MIGEACALLAALTWSVSVILFKRSESAEVSPLAMNLFKNVVALALLLLTLTVLMANGLAWPSDRSREDWVRLIASGVLGIAVADTLIFMALRELGASMLAVVDCSYAPTIVALSVLVLGEPLSWAFAGGSALVVLGVLATVFEAEEGDALPRARRWRGIAIGVAGIVTMAVGVVWAKPALEHGNLVEVTTTRLAAGVVAQFAWVFLAPGRRSALQVFRQRSVWPTLLPASILGTYVAMLFWLGGFKWTKVSTASVLNQLSSVFTVLLAWLFLGERLTRLRIFGTVTAVAGAAWIFAVRV